MAGWTGHDATQIAVQAGVNLPDILKKRWLDALPSAPLRDPRRPLPHRAVR